MAEKNEEKTKILICGDVEGRFNALFKRVDSLNKKTGPFELLLCVGNFFGINNTEFDGYKNGIKKVPIPTYVLGANKEDHIKLFNKKDELCPNVYYLGKRGLYTSTGGLKIAYISGLSSNDGRDYNFNLEDVQLLKDVCIKGDGGFRGVDILLTSQWPNYVMNGNKTQVNLKEKMGSDLISWLSYMLKPRYHIAGLEGVFYERSPYRIINDNNQAVTRFLGLARVGNLNKEKWLYALNLMPVDKFKLNDIIQRTTDETTCPYNIEDLNAKLFNTKRKSDDQYFYDMNPMEDVKKKFNKRQKIEFDKSKCWFCLASPSVEKHLVITVGNSTYLALAKGGLVEEHFLICPIEHYQCSVGQPEEVQLEVKQFKEALTKFYERNDNVPVFFERNYKTSHMQIQAVPIPKKAQNDLEDIFKDEAEGHGIQLNKLDESNKLEHVVKQGMPYFVVELPDGSVLYTKVKGGNFPLNFGREVLTIGAILNLNDRIDWKDCLLNKEEEVTLVNRIRNDFESYDFTN